MRYLSIGIVPDLLCCGQLMYLGIGAYFIKFEDLSTVAGTFLALCGSFMVSYARARAGGLGISCRVGIFTRLERFIVLTLALIFEQLLVGLIILAFMANFTALQRLFHVYRQSLHE